MKRTILGCLVLVALALLAACHTATPIPAPLPASMKGYELYSWQEGGEWRFTLITGTNRNKTREEIVSPEDRETAEGWVKLTASGEDSILQVLRRLPKGEHVLWSTSLAPGFALPPQEMVGRIRAECDRLGLDLAVM